MRGSCSDGYGRVLQVPAAAGAGSFVSNTRSRSLLCACLEDEVVVPRKSKLPIACRAFASVSTDRLLLPLVPFSHGNGADVAVSVIFIVMYAHIILRLTTHRIWFCFTQDLHQYRHGK